MAKTMVLIALGSNRPHSRYGGSRAVLAAAIAALSRAGLDVRAVSRAYRTAPVGPPQPAYVNAAVRATTRLSAPDLMRLLLEIEAAFGRRRGQRWTARVLDLDLIGYGQAILPGRTGWRQGRGLVIPHRRAHERAFVLTPLAAVAPLWRHPVLGLTVRQLESRRRAGRAVRPWGTLNLKRDCDVGICRDAFAGAHAGLERQDKTATFRIREK